MKSILVLGGSGFVGQEVCLEALKRGWAVSSLSRSGPPSAPLTPQLLSAVTWHKGSAMDPASYNPPSGKNILQEVDYLVHSIGVLISTAQISYHDASVETLKVALTQPNNLKALGYISAANFGSAFRSVLPGYYSSKSEAEEILSETQACGNVRRVVIARPGLMWGDGRWLTKPISTFYNIGTFFAAGLFPRAIPASSVANKMLNYLEDECSGLKILEVQDMID